MIKIYSKGKDDVIKGYVALGEMPYSFAIEKLVPLLDKTKFQRKIQDKKFYEKLERDILNGCLMPPISIAYITQENEITDISSLEEIQEFILRNMNNVFILDGIQRLNTLNSAKTTSNKNEGNLNTHLLDMNQVLYVNVIFCESVDNLLYRMITLNNGQKPMSARHQVEMLVDIAFDFSVYCFKVFNEKEELNKIRGEIYFKKADIVQAYLAYMTEKPLIDNKKIIESKMDELLASNIMNSELDDTSHQFKQILRLISNYSHLQENYKWLFQANNLIGFSVGSKKNTETLNNLDAEEFKIIIDKFEEAFTIFNKSTIKVGKIRREMITEYFKRISNFIDKSIEDIAQHFVEITSDE
ncbi:hypothetical protein [Acinetobacter bereziniae]|uniref:hypothetical protein n=1 Tax=Acinetobacter bereziniae TaxID=106648 RepID=UPI001ABC0DF6|nr:hypothetical protein [Acinetobacter bereziniae]MBO3654683.1 hypothetical protein [Acinetobacter bereziniae]